MFFKKNSKKLALGLSILMVLGSLAGCTTKPEEPAPVVTPPVVEPEPVVEPQPEPEPAVEPEPEPVAVRIDLRPVP